MPHDAPKESLCDHRAASGDKDFPKSMIFQFKRNQITLTLESQSPVKAEQIKNPGFENPGLLLYNYFVVSQN